MTSLHTEVLDDRARSALDAHGASAHAEGFYLAGGTALALQLGHRRSVDFDWFREREFDPLDLAQRLIARRVPFITDSTARATLHGSVHGTRVSFIEFRYPRLAPTVDGGLGFELAGLLDIGTMKLSAIAQRGARKDFYDLAALGRAGITLGSLIDAYRMRFAVRDVAHLLMALTYFDDAERDTQPILQSRDDWAGVKETLRGWVRELAGR